MSNRITKIEERLPTPSTLPDGLYNGIWGGYQIELTFNGKTYYLTTEEGVRGIGVKVVVTIINGVATFAQVKN